MFNFIKSAHNLLGMTILTVLLLVVILVLISFLRKKPFEKLPKIAALVGLITVHLQILLGLLLYFMSPLGVTNFSGESMGHSISRFYLVEHPIGMILAAFLITLGYKRAKRKEFSDSKKHSQILIFYTLGLFIVGYLIPWFLWN